MCTLVARIVRLRPTFIVTFFVVSGFYDRVKGEIARDFLRGEEHMLSRIRRVEGVHDTSSAEDAFETAYRNIIDDKSLTCANTGTTFDPHPVRPTVAILDMFVVRAFEIVKTLSSNTVKVYTWYPAATKSFHYYFAEDLVPACEAEAASRGMSFNDVAYERFSNFTGRVVRTPCAPTMHDWEYNPQATRSPREFIGNILIKVGGQMKRTDGFITFDAAEYCPTATESLRFWFAETGRKCYYAGPLVPQQKEEPLGDPRSYQIKTFLDQKLASHGEKSVIYISFGSMFWPTEPEKLWAVFDVLMERHIPFILSTSAVFAKTPPPEVQEKVAQYGDAMITDWVPQQYLLDHPATGWYLSHGGHNSTLETILAGVPNIVWPVYADQPVNAIHLSEDLDVAYELFEVRCGTGLGQILRNGKTPTGTVEAVKAEMHNVLDHAFGDDGARKRVNLQAVRKKLQAAWAEDGIARREVEAFLDDL
ncbi:UDP-Glycosyltransferase/glycogen phosphorylase [Dichomitus squalens]|uniref:UDP-Glycosyltransferase/glycogen phosphorylase n=1 Tax=Dichomitus squalens TaxID=114155 RepID=A0A4Q9N2K3_9APHY|nr:UDP-Glycosyltransferase/glycogen phosphorylase [Dichomitus squalens]